MCAFINTRKLAVFFAAVYLIYGNSVFARSNNTLEEIDETFDEIEENHNRLRKLFKSLFEKVQEPLPLKIDIEGQPNSSGNCTCVPLYQCSDEGHIIKDGRVWISSRTNNEETLPTHSCENLLDVCCKEPIEKPIPKSTCGYSGNITKKGIRLSEDTSLFGEFPWTVMLLENLEKPTYRCVGALIHPQVVLTSAHCINSTKNYTARVGEWDWYNKKEPLPYESQLVETIIIHPQYNPKNLHYDAALLVLSERFDLADNVNIACISDFASCHLKAVSEKCVASGWGGDKGPGNYKRVMKRIEFSLMQHKLCEERFRTTTPMGKWFELHNSFICALGHNGLDLCTGDGGGPLVCPIPGTPNRYQLVGITSWGIGCSDKNPAVFTRVSEIKQWIDGWFSVFRFDKVYEHESVRLLY